MGYVAGIQVERGDIVIHPYPSKRIGYASASYKSAFGTIISSWKYEGDKVVFRGTLLEGKIAIFIAPDGGRQEISGEWEIQF